MNYIVMKNGMIYIHGKGGSADEAARYERAFPEYDVVGFDYRCEVPWDAMTEFKMFYESFEKEHNEVFVIANSIGAFFTLNALAECKIKKAYFISPIVDMERLIADMMIWANTNESELFEKLEIKTAFGETLSWKYLTWVREHPIKWNTPTKILYGSGDTLQRIETINAFAEKTGATVTVMEGGEHWFHTQEQMAFLDKWITEE